MQVVNSPVTGDGSTIAISGAGVVSAVDAGIATQAELDALSAALTAHAALDISDAHGGAIDTADIADGAVTAAKVAADVATQAELDAVSASLAAHAALDISDAHGGAIDTADIADGAVTAAKLAAGVLVETAVTPVVNNSGAAAWRDWDLTAALPAGTRIAFISGGVGPGGGSGAGSTFGVRADGSAQDRRLPTNGAHGRATFPVAVPASRIIEYYDDGLSATTNIRYYLLGYI